MRAATAVLFVAAFAISSIGLSGSSVAAHHKPAPQVRTR
jgi:hypothetical protein